MNIEMLFEKRKIIGENILNIIRDNGYTKSSFAKLLDITRPTLDRIISGEIDSLTKFKQYISKIIETQGIDMNYLLSYTPRTMEVYESAFVCSFNAPTAHEVNKRTKEMFSILDDVLHLCEIYYK